MAREQSIAYSVLTTRFQVSAGEVISVAIAPTAALKGVAVAILGPDAKPVAVYGGGAASQGSIFAPRAGNYSAVFGNTTAPGITSNFNVTVIDCGDGVKLLTFTEGAINHYRGIETVTVYCNSDGGVNVWTDTHSVGYFAFTATSRELATVSDRPHNDTLVKSDLGVAVYRLTTGHLKINAGNGYTFIWSADCMAAV